MKDCRQHVAPLIIFLVFLLIFVPSSHAGAGQDISEPKKDIFEPKKGPQKIRQLLGPRPHPFQSRPMPIAASVGIDDDPILGDSKAPLTLIEFSDYQCPFCGRFSRDIFPRIKKEYIETGKVRYVFRDFPLPFYVYAQKAAEAAQCAGDQGRYWEMHDFIFVNQHAIKVEDLKGYARRIGLNIETFNTCLDTNRYSEEVRKDREAGRKAGVRRIPSFVLGRTTDNGKIVGRFISGAQPYEVFKSALEDLLTKRREK
ncbi:MAG: DsbA family protein [Nitrospinota bacterium]